MYNFFLPEASRLYAKQPTYFNFLTTIYPKLMELGIEIWYAGGCVGP